MLRSKFLLLSLLTIGVFSSYTYLTKPSFFKVDDLKYDFQYFRTVLEKAHPSLYRYVPKDTLDKRFDEAFNKIQAPMGQNSFWQIVQSVCTEIACGHTTVIRPDSLAFKDVSVIPFYLSIRDNRLFVTRYIQSPANYGYRIRDELIEINHKPVAEILTQIRQLIPSEGYSESSRNFMIETGSFNMIYAYINNSSSKFNFLFKRKSEIFSVEMESSVTSRYFSCLSCDFIKIDYRLSYPNDLANTALLKIRKFKSSNFVNEYAAVFKELAEKKTANLIIDLRNNPGGQTDIAIEFLKYLIGRDFLLSKTTERVVNIGQFVDLFEKDNAPSLSTVKRINHQRFYGEVSSNKLYSPYYGRFYTGKVFVLINGGTFSVAALLATALKEQLNCTVVGQETGGGNWGCNGGKAVKVTLPKTKLKLNIPLMWTNSVDFTENKGRGLLPDYEVSSYPIIVDDPKNVQYDPLLRKVKQLIN